MKEPWRVYLPCCCCCWPKRTETNPSKHDPERGHISISTTTSISNNLHEISPAERAIDLALRHSSELHAEDIQQEEANPPPPSYDSVLKDNDRRNPRSGRPAELQGSSAGPRFPSPVATGKEGFARQQQQPSQQQHQPQESVFSDEDDVVVLTPPTTAPPTVLDEDSDDDERIHGPFRDR